MKRPVTITAVWLRNIGEHVEALVEINGVWRVACREYRDSAFSHIAEGNGADNWPADPDTYDPNARPFSAPPADARGDADYLRALGVCTRASGHSGPCNGRPRADRWGACHEEQTEAAWAARRLTTPPAGERGERGDRGENACPL